MRRLFRKKTPPPSSGSRFWIVTVAILLLGFLLAIAFIFVTMTQRCVSMADYWFESSPGLYRLFVWAFILLFVWNLLLFFASYAGIGKEELVHFLMNAVALLVIGFVLLRLYQFVLEYEAVYRHADASWNATSHAQTFFEPCKTAKPFIGRWSIRILDGDSESEFPYTVLYLHRDLGFELRNKNDIKHTGRWLPPDYHGNAITLDYDGGDQLRILGLQEFAGDRMLLEQTTASIDNEAVAQFLKLELRRLSGPAGR
jgi:hypothetical protein